MDFSSSLREELDIMWALDGKNIIPSTQVSTLKLKSLGLIGHSIVRYFPSSLIGAHFNRVSKFRTSLILNLQGGDIMTKVKTHDPMIEVAVFILGGNDLDSRDHTTEHIRDLHFTYTQNIKTLIEHGIKVYILPIQSRNTPRNTTTQEYNTQRHILNEALSQHLFRTHGYKVMLGNLRHQNEHVQDGIHFTDRDYTTWTAKIIAHIAYTHDQPLNTNTPITRAVHWRETINRAEDLGSPEEDVTFRETFSRETQEEGAGGRELAVEEIQDAGANGRELAVEEIQEAGASGRDLAAEGIRVENTLRIEIGGVRGRGISRGALRGRICSRLGSAWRSLGGDLTSQQDKEETRTSGQVVRAGPSQEGQQEEDMGEQQWDTRESEAGEEILVGQMAEEYGVVLQRSTRETNMGEGNSGSTHREGQEINRENTEEERQGTRMDRRVAALLKFARPEDKLI